MSGEQTAGAAWSPGLRRVVAPAQFDRTYDEVVIGNHFFEEPAYYRRARPRYRRSIEYIASLPLPRPANVLEIGGGQIGLLMTRLFGDRCTLGDISEKYADAVTRFGIKFINCDLLHDDIGANGQYDLVVLCEVIEHVPVPAHIVLSKIRNWIRPGGYLFLTTPNLYRLRNVIRLALGMPVFCHFFYPKKGSSIGHPLEYSDEHLAWQLRTAGYDVQLLEQVQLENSGASIRAHAARSVLAPLLMLVPRWRDNLVCLAVRRSDAPQPAQ